jgi:O-antigen/teichoic acid export membrane protein
VRIVAAVVAYISLIALARWMGASEYGAYAYAITWAGLLALPAALGLPIVSLRFIAEYSAAGEWAKVRGLLGRGVSLTLMASVGIWIVATTAIVAAGSSVPAAYRVPLLLALFGLPVIALTQLAMQVGRAFGWVVAAFMPSQVLHPLMLLAFAGVFVAAGRELSASRLVVATMIVATVSVIGQGTVFAWRLRPRLRNVAPQHDQKMWLRVAAPLLLVDVFLVVITFADIIMVGILLDPSSVAFYVAASRTAGMVTFFTASIGALTGPRIAELNSQGRLDEVQELLRGITPWIAIPATLAALALIATGPFVLPLFGEGFEVAWTPLIILSIGNLIWCVNGPASLVLTMTGHHDITAKVYVVSAVASVLLNAILIPWLGLTGAAIATAVTLATMSSYLVVVARRTLSIRTGLSSLRR